MKPLFLASVLLGAVTCLAAVEDVAQIRLLDETASLFAERATSWRVELTDPDTYAGRVAWSLSVSGAVIARREQSITLRSNEATVLVVGVDLPAIREGVVADGQLSITLLDGRNQPRAEREFPIYVFGKDPTVHRAEWLQGLKLHVFDPDGETVQRLKDLGWPCRRITNLAALETLGSSVLIVGEGCSLRTQRGLMESALHAAKNGARIVFLAPTEGSFAPPGLAEGGLGPTTLQFHDGSFVRTLDKRLDVPPLRGTFRLGGQRTGPEVVVEPSGGWACMEMRWANGGTLLMGGFGLLGTWESSPVPRYLLVRMLEWVTTEKEREL